MENNKKLEMAIADLMVRLSSLEKILLSKQIINKEEYLAQINEITEKAIEAIKQQ